MLWLAGANSTSQLNTSNAPDTHDYFFATSTFISDEAPMTQAASDALFKYFHESGTNTSVKWFAIFDLYGGGDSAITKAGPDHNAFNARDALYSIQYYGTIPNGTVTDKTGIEFIQDMKKAVESNMPGTHFKEYG